MSSIVRRGWVSTGLKLPLGAVLHGLHGLKSDFNFSESKSSVCRRVCTCACPSVGECVRGPSDDLKQTTVTVRVETVRKTKSKSERKFRFSLLSSKEDHYQKGRCFQHPPDYYFDRKGRCSHPPAICQVKLCEFEFSAQEPKWPRQASSATNTTELSTSTPLKFTLRKKINSDLEGRCSHQPVRIAMKIFSLHLKFEFCATEPKWPASTSKSTITKLTYFLEHHLTHVKHRNAVCSSLPSDLHASRALTSGLTAGGASAAATTAIRAMSTSTKRRGEASQKTSLANEVDFIQKVNIALSVQHRFAARISFLQEEISRRHLAASDADTTEATNTPICTTGRDTYYLPTRVDFSTTSTTMSALEAPAAGSEESVGRRQSQSTRVDFSEVDFGKLSIAKNLYSQKLNWQFNFLPIPPALIPCSKGVLGVDVNISGAECILPASLVIYLLPNTKWPKSFS